MNWWDNIPGQSQQGGGGWWQQTQPMQYPGAIQPTGAMAQPSPSAPKWIGAGVPATGFLRMIQGIMQGGQQTQQPTAVQGAAQQPATVKPPVPLAPGAGIGSMPGAGGGQFFTNPNRTAYQSPLMMQTLKGAGVPVRRYLPWATQSQNTGIRERLGVGVPAAYLHGAHPYVDGGEYTQLPKPTTPTTTTTAGTGDGGGGYSSGYFSGSGYSYKAPKQPWYMELMSWNIGE